MSQGPCRLTLWQHGVGEAADGNETFTSSKGVDHNDHASAYSTSGNCTNTSWGVFFHNPPEQGSGIVIGKGDAAGGPLWNTHGEGKGSLNHRFYKIDDEISFVKKIEFPQIPEGAILENVDVYGRRADGRQGEWGHYPYIDKLDLDNPNHSQQLLLHAGVGGASELKGQPCPGGSGIPIGHRTYRCMYTNSGEIQGLYNAVKDTQGHDPRRDLYGKVVKKYCEADNERINDQVGGDYTCEDFGVSRETWCSQDERIKSDPGCTESIVGKGVYHKLAKAYCTENPGDIWCSCFNISSGVCSTDMAAAGCKHAYGALEENKEALGPAIEIGRAKAELDQLNKGSPEWEEVNKRLQELEAQNGYQILKDNAHCRQDACERGYLPENVKGNCKDSYKICGEDIDIKNQSNSDIVVACNTGIPYVLPSWWNDPLPPYERPRKPPYNLFPLNKTPMTHWPKKFRWRSKNVKYHVYSGAGLSTACCLCIIMMFMMMRMRRR